ncbi:60S ribosomal protein L26 (nucleomorph) [Chroomonas mesostigmatica CCMP1168]|uniref:60S ribosomal protein L26 n=1 Tax=Chroomonas mesostigmatica CCMP1168 TaxID=1195612 RepID=J7G817_9CRYP|nr:60S ribosomal protein L26 [Chroomonas mesostigmatica CCMP1168]|mmetsp:Transcript_66762/g.164529  ORF Transcript_66762/g.164529 Transcript_66762/m.164529 type:complete len:125 (+) Transcript_66762:5026-5400(+)
MKFSHQITRSKRKNRKKFSKSSSCERRRKMVSPLSKDLKIKYNVSSVPIRKEDEVQIIRGSFKGKRGKIVQCHRKNFHIFIDKIINAKTSKNSSYVPISPSNVIVTGINLNHDRKIFFSKKMSL